MGKGRYGAVSGKNRLRMGSIKTLWRVLLIWLRIIHRPDLLVRVISDHPSPDSMKPGCIYIVGGQGYKKWAYFRCPADTTEIIQLSLMQNRTPSWELTIDSLDRPTINPSVRQLEGSYAHFWIKKGCVEWCEDTGRKCPSTRRV